MSEILKHPWPWYVAGPIIGLMVPCLLLLGNKQLGISSSLRHICAACFPGQVPFFNYDWKKEVWNLYFAAGIIAGAIVATQFLSDPDPVNISGALRFELKNYGIDQITGMVPQQLFSWSQLFTGKGLILMIGGGFLIGFGTRYAGGCTSGHSIMGLSTLQWPSLVATISFMAGGFLMANCILPILLHL